MDDLAHALVWDAGNLAHLSERNEARRASNQREVTRDEVDALYESLNYVTEEVEYLTHDGWEIQIRLIGRSPENRFLTVACDVLEDGRLRPATVWLSSRAEQRRYWLGRENAEGDHDANGTG